MNEVSIRRMAGRAILNVGAWIVVGIVIFPLLWMVSTALRPESELFAFPPALLPTKPVLTHFWRLLTATPFPIYLLNSAIVAVCTTLLVVIVGTLGAYSLARFRYRGRELIGWAILFTYLLPSVVLLLPLYLLMSWMGLTNSLLSLIVAHSTFALPFSLWLLRSFIEGIPIELEEAARVDGASRLGVFWDVVLPQAIPGIISTAIFAFILSWNEYLYATVLISRDTNKTLPPGVITMLTSAFNVEWPLLMAASICMSVPLIFIFSVLQRYLISGLSAGAVKG